MPKKKRDLRSQNSRNLGIYSKKQKTSMESPIGLPSNTSPSNEQMVDSAGYEDDLLGVCEPVRVRREVRLLSQGTRDRRRGNISSDGNEAFGNRILPMKNLQDVIQKELCCRKCTTNIVKSELEKFAMYCDNHPNVGGISELLDKYNNSNAPPDAPPVKFAEETVGIATKLQCHCDSHGNLFETSVSRTSYKGNKKNYNAYESYALNCMLILSMQQVGAAGTETDRLLSFLNLPNGNSF